MTQWSGSANAGNLLLGYSLEDPACPAIPDPLAPITWVQKVGGTTADAIFEVIETGRRSGTGIAPLPILGATSAPVGVGMGAAPIVMAPWFGVMTNNNITNSIVVDVGLNILDRTWQLDPAEPKASVTWWLGIQDIPEPMIWRIDGFRLDQMVMTAAVGSFLSSRFTGQGSGYSYFTPPADAMVPNLGTHGGPWFRGTPRPELDGHLFWVRVEDTGTAPDQPLKFKIVAKPQGDFVIPGDFDAAAGPYHQEYFTTADGQRMATWRNAQDQTGHDIGIIDDPGTNHPAQICFPGLLEDTALLVQQGDVWAVAGPGATQPLLVPTYLDEPGFTISHLKVKIYDAQDDVTETLLRNDATITWAHAQEVTYGDTSSFPTLHNRTDDQMLTLTSNVGMTSPRFQHAAAQGKRYDVTLTIGGAQWDGVDAVDENEDAPRRTTEINMFDAMLLGAPKTMANAAAITEALSFRAETSTYRTIDEVAP